MKKRQLAKRAKVLARSKSGNTVQIVVETPRGCRNKYKYDQDTKRIKLSKVMPEGMIFPYDFGFIPGSCAEDGDPLDVLVLTDEPTFPGCEIDCRVLGVIKAYQKEEGEQNRNDRLIAVAEQSLLYGDMTDLSDLDPKVLKQIEAFFVNYQKVRDVDVKILARKGAEEAMDIVTKARSRRAA